MSVAGRNRRGFTLLEVLIAVAILGLALTVILSSQVGLFSSHQHAGNLSVAVGLSRCKMGELEEKLLRTGYPLADENDEGPCCGDEEERAFHCTFKIERVQLPKASGLDSMGRDGGVDLASGGLGALGALATGGQMLGADAGIGSIASMLSGAGTGTGTGATPSAQSMAPLVMGMVYPDLKPMLEESIRKVTVVVHWKEGGNDRELSIEQYITNPTQGGLGMPGTAMPGMDPADMFNTPQSTGTAPHPSTGPGVRR